MITREWNLADRRVLLASLLALAAACAAEPGDIAPSRSTAFSRGDGGSFDGGSSDGGSFDGGSSDGGSGCNFNCNGDGGTAAFVNPLPIPPVLQPTSSTSTSDDYNITVKAAHQQVLSGNQTTIWGFNGIWPGPTIVATKGKQVRVTRTNALTEYLIHDHSVVEELEQRIARRETRMIYLPGLSRERLKGNRDVPPFPVNL